MATIQSGKLGAFGFYPQTTVGTDPGSGVTFKWMRGSVAEFAPQQQVKDLGMLIGGTLLPEGQVKTGIFSGGRFVAPPFLDDHFGWILRCFAGGSASAAHGDAGNKLYKHYFPSNVLPDTTYPDDVLCIHKITPADETYDMGEQFLDCMVTRMQFGFAGGDFVTWSGEFLGKRPLKENATGTDWTVTDLKCKESVPITALPLTTALQFPIATNIAEGQAVMLDMRNVTPGYQDVAVLGSYDPHSWPVLGRQLMVTVRLLFTTDDLYSLAFYDGAGVWNPAIFTSSFQVTAQSPGYIDSDVYSPTPGALTLTSTAFTDATGDFSAYDVTPPTTATHWIQVWDSNGNLIAKGFIGDLNGGNTSFKVYKDIGTTVAGWTQGGTGTPATYQVSPCVRYELGFSAPSVTWTATPPTLSGNDLLRVDFQGQIAAACPTSPTSPDWNLWVINKTANYTWPT